MVQFIPPGDWLPAVLRRFIFWRLWSPGEVSSKIITFIIKAISALWRCKPSEILDEIPFAIRKTPIFSLLSGGSLVSLAALSPFTAFGLAIEALYGGNSKRANFDWIDPNENYEHLLLITAVAAAIFFNVFPAPYVQEWLSTKYCLLFGAVREKRAIETLQVLKATHTRAERIPVKAFSGVYSLQQPPDNYTWAIISNKRLAAAPENCCTRLTKWFCGLWGRGSIATPEPNDGNSYYSITSSTRLELTAGLVLNIYLYNQREWRNW